MLSQISLNDRQWQLVMELLDNERRNLPSEIRRTDSLEYQQGLEDRLKDVDELIERLRQSPVAG